MPSRRGEGCGAGRAAWGTGLAPDNLRSKRPVSSVSCEAAKTSDAGSFISLLAQEPAGRAPRFPETISGRAGGSPWRPCSFQVGSGSASRPLMHHVRVPQPSHVWVSSRSFVRSFPLSHMHFSSRRHFHGCSHFLLHSFTFTSDGRWLLPFSRPCQHARAHTHTHKELPLSSWSFQFPFTDIQCSCTSPYRHVHSRALTHTHSHLPGLQSPNSLNQESRDSCQLKQ